MKKKNIIYPVFILLFTWGCEFLNYDESSFYEKEDVFSDFERMKGFLTDIYSYLPTDYTSIDNAMRSSATDESEFVLDFSDVQKFNNGTWSAIQVLDAQWSAMYAGIRAANIFLKEAKDQEFEEYRWNDEYGEMMAQYHNYPNEARFLRAFFYFELIKRYGDAPLILEPLTLEEANSLTRTPFNEIVDFIVEECDDISSKLPVDYNNLPNKETGRITRGAAMALKSRVLLYAASPLHNSAGSADKWIKAAEASKAVIDSSWYTLENNWGAFLNKRASKEVILGRRQGVSNQFEQVNFPVGYHGIVSTGNCPTQNLVDAFEMKPSGLPVTDPASGYDENNPYAGRDPRLAKTVILNNSTWKGQTVEIWEGGLNAPPLERATKTGYYLKKYVDETINLTPGSVTAKEHHWAIFRLGEVLLNYAEAMNEAYGPDDAAGLGLTARGAVNMVRSRASMPGFPAGLSKEEFREKLRNERRVELAFEDHRFWDVRRWKIGNTTKDIYGMKITKAQDQTFNYEKVLVENRVWDDKMYLYPIPQSEIYKNNKLTQNPGWER